jgi:hypothetical protein
MGLGQLAEDILFGNRRRSCHICGHLFSVFHVFCFMDVPGI